MRDQERSPESERRANERREQTWIKLGMEPPKERSPEETIRHFLEMFPVSSEPALEALAVLGRRLEDAETQWMEAQEAGLELAGENIRLERWVVENAEEVGLLERQLAEKDEALREIAAYPQTREPILHPWEIAEAALAREALRAEPAKEEA